MTWTKRKHGWLAVLLDIYQLHWITVKLTNGTVVNLTPSIIYIILILVWMFS